MALLQQGGTAVAGVEGTAELYSLEGSGETQHIPPSGGPPTIEKQFNTATGL